ncbi:FtsX-like permease family protein [Vibrio parahaemolyticus]|uniref:ABC transporter permease n=1 Tax=Vibrio TaxID=662 RepID=UPI000C7C367E|nr:ABC transporter permease [Vibrio harveyi]AWA98050.1 hypothetical protein CU052_00930 [Vibrio harveyi]EGQ8545501.1 FtsX-like permease family protein [Vibrio parahaemolyticus]ELC3210015.1 ABC transporter permease [Vibrio parahaemolyticus]
MYSQIPTLLTIGLHSLKARLSGTFVAVFCVASVVFLFISVLSMLEGFRETMERTGQEDVAIVMRSGALSEVNSVLNVSDLPAMLTYSEIEMKDGKKLASGQFYLVVEMAKKNGAVVNVPMRGIELTEPELHPSFQLTHGRMFKPGTTEVVVGAAASSQFEGLQIGETMTVQGIDWVVVGIFEDGGNVYESEIWSDLHFMQAAFKHQETLQSLRVKLVSDTAFESYSSALENDPRFDIEVQRETDYYASGGSGLITLAQKTVYPMAVLMMIGAIFAALNAMYASVSARTTEIATLRALGFADGAVSIAVLLEAVLVALFGGLIGTVLVFLLVDGFLFSTMNGEAFSQLVFRFTLSPPLIMEGMSMALVIGVVSGLFPALVVIYTPLNRALRKV